MRTSLTVCAIALSSQLLCAEGIMGQSLKENNITYMVKKISVSEAFEQLSEITGFNFFYDESVLKDLKGVNIQVKNGSIDTILNEMSRQTGLYFKKINNTISVSRSRFDAPGTESVQQSRKLTGIIRDNTGEPIIGANVIVKGTTNGTITGIDGDFSLEMPESGILVISYIGYLSREVPIGRESSIDVTLSEDTQRLDEVVVVGYGVQKKANLTGAVASVKMEEVMGSRPLPNAADALQGTVPGLLVTNNGNAPGTSKSFQIRGAYSVGIKNDDGSYGSAIKPLVLIDNVEGDLDMINPEDIETVTVLKDAASAAIYGARAAGGVILVTTKRPKGATTFQLNYNNNFAFANAINLPKQAPLMDYLQAYSDAAGDQFWTMGSPSVKKWMGYLE